MSLIRVVDKKTGQVHHVTAEQLAQRRAPRVARSRTSGGKRIVMRDLKGKSSTRHGHHYAGEDMKGHHAEVVPGESIRLFGVDTNRVNGPVEYDITFHVGDYAIYEGYNLTYTGPIVKIAANTVSIDANSTGRARLKRFTIAEFNRANRHYDAEKIAKRNSEWRD